VVYGQTRAEVRRKLAELVAQAHRDSLAQPQSRALPSLDNPHLHDALGHKRLQAIRPTHIRAFLDGLALPARGIRMVRSLQRSAFEEAVALEIIHHNPVQPVRLKLPPPTRQGRVLEPGELGLLLAALDAQTLAIRRAWTGGVVRPAVSPTKNRRSERLVPVPTLSWHRLLTYRSQLVQAGFSAAALIRMWLFPSSKDPSRPVEPNAPNYALRRICN
jgi:integrase